MTLKLSVARGAHLAVTKRRGVRHHPFRAGQDCRPRIPAVPIVLFVFDRKPLNRLASANAQLRVAPHGPDHGGKTGAVAPRRPASRGGADGPHRRQRLVLADRHGQVHVAFNASQHEVYVELSVITSGLQGGYAQQIDAAKANNAPDIMHVEFQALAQMLLTGGTVMSPSTIHS